MADNVKFQPSPATAPNGTVVATDKIDGVDYQRMKLILGANGVNDGDVCLTNPMPVTGPLTDTELRATPVPISGTVTATVDTSALATSAKQLPDDHNVNVSNFPITQQVAAISWPLPGGAATAANQANISAAVTFTANAQVDGTQKAQIRYVDETGTAYGVKHVMNKPRVSSMPYLYDIAEGNVPGHYGLNKFGHNDAVPATLEDVWDGSAVYTWPTVAATVNAAAGATDGGVISYTSTATGGSTTTLIDTAQEFTAGNVVAAGDLILDDDNDEIGYVTGVAVTTLTFATTKDTAFTLGTNYRIVDKSAGGVGAQAIQVQGLDANYVMQKEFIVLNNATNVPTASTYLRMFRAIVLLSGSAGWNVANITLTGAALIAQITAQENQTLMAVWTVPAGHTFYMTDYYAATSSAKVTEAHLYARPFGGVFNIKSVIVLNQGKSSRDYHLPLKFAEKTDITIQAQAAGGGGSVSAGFSGWYEN